MAGGCGDSLCRRRLWRWCRQVSQGDGFDRSLGANDFGGHPSGLAVDAANLPPVIGRCATHDIQACAFQNLFEHEKIGAWAAACVHSWDTDDDCWFGYRGSCGGRRRWDICRDGDGVERALFVDQFAEHPHRLFVDAAHLPPVAGVVFAHDGELGAGGKLGHLIVRDVRSGAGAYWLARHDHDGCWRGGGRRWFWGWRLCGGRHGFSGLFSRRGKLWVSQPAPPASVLPGQPPR